MRSYRLKIVSVFLIKAAIFVSVQKDYWMTASFSIDQISILKETGISAYAGIQLEAEQNFEAAYNGSTNNGKFERWWYQLWQNLCVVLIV